MKQARVLTEAELKRVLATVADTRHGARNRMALMLSHLAGLRVGEIEALTVRDVIDSEGKVREHFDIPAMLMEQLFEAGVGLVSDLDICTYANPGVFFSHRYATHHGTTTGRQIAIIGLT